MQRRQGCRAGNTFPHAGVQIADLVTRIVHLVIDVFNVRRVFIHFFIQRRQVLCGRVFLFYIIAVFLHTDFFVNGIAAYKALIAFRYTAFNCGNHIVFRNLDGRIVSCVGLSAILKHIFCNFITLRHVQGVIIAFIRYICNDMVSFIGDAFRCVNILNFHGGRINVLGRNVVRGDAVFVDNGITGFEFIGNVFKFYIRSGRNRYVIARTGNFNILTSFEIQNIRCGVLFIITNRLEFLAFYLGNPALRNCIVQITDRFRKIGIVSYIVVGRVIGITGNVVYRVAIHYARVARLYLAICRRVHRVRRRRDPVFRLTRLVDRYIFAGLHHRVVQVLRHILVDRVTAYDLGVAFLDLALRRRVHRVRRRRDPVFRLTRLVDRYIFAGLHHRVVQVLRHILVDRVTAYDLGVAFLDLTLCRRVHRVRRRRDPVYRLALAVDGYIVAGLHHRVVQVLRHILVDRVTAYDLGVAFLDLTLCRRVHRVRRRRDPVYRLALAVDGYIVAGLHHRVVQVLRHILVDRVTAYDLGVAFLDFALCRRVHRVRRRRDPVYRLALAVDGYIVAGLHHRVVQVLRHILVDRVTAYDLGVAFLDFALCRRVHRVRRRRDARLFIRNTRLVDRYVFAGFYDRIRGNNSCSGNSKCCYTVNNRRCYINVSFTLDIIFGIGIDNLPGILRLISVRIIFL